MTAGNERYAFSRPPAVKDRRYREGGCASTTFGPWTNFGDALPARFFPARGAPRVDPARIARHPCPSRRFEELARELFSLAVRFAWRPFRRLCEGHGVTPATLRSWRDIPAMPQQLFKRAKLFAHGNAKPGADL